MRRRNPEPRPRRYVPDGEQRNAPDRRGCRPVKIFRDFWMRTKANAVDYIDFEIRPGDLRPARAQWIEQEHDHQDDSRSAQDLGSLVVFGKASDVAVRSTSDSSGGSTSIGT